VRPIEDARIIALSYAFETQNTIANGVLRGIDRAQKRTRAPQTRRVGEKVFLVLRRKYLLFSPLFDKHLYRESTARRERVALADKLSAV
jgi:hypothetical protein